MRNPASATTFVSAQSPPITQGLPTGSRLLRLVSSIPTAGYADADSLYLTQTSPLGEHTGEIYELTRLDPQTGQILATRRFDDQLDDLLLARGSLWATTNGSDTTLWRLDPRSLIVRSRLSLAASRASDGIVGSLADAGGNLWVGTDELDQVSLSSGRVTNIVTVPFPGPIQLAADPLGRILIARLGADPVHIAELNPRTGVMLSQQTIRPRGTQVTLGGVLDRSVWIENATGPQTVIARFSLDPLTPARKPPLTKQANRITVRVLNNVLWVTQPLGKSNLNYCADPATGRPLVELPPLPGDSVLLAANDSRIFYTDVPVNAHSVKLETAPISPRCHP